MWLDRISKTWRKIPQKWRWAIISWASSFFISWIVVTIWGLGTLLTIFLLIFVIAYLLARFGAANWAISQFFKHIRCTMIFALLPAIWPIIREITTDFSWGLLIELLLVFLLIVYIWSTFNKVIERLMTRRLDLPPN